MWLKFHTHVHSNYSDGHSSLRDMVAAAQDQGVDLLIITDHNTVHPQGSLDALEEEFKIALVSGIEYSTFHGHLIQWQGAYTPWEAIGPKDLAKLAERANATGGRLGIAHPACAGAPLCPGCSFEFEADLDQILYTEIWHASVNVWQERQRNEAFYLKQLAKGYPLYHYFGGDYHIASEFSVPDINYTWVDQKPKDPQEVKEVILAALDEGRVLISRGSRYQFNLRQGSHWATAGDTMTLDPSQDLEIHLDHLEDCQTPLQVRAGDQLVSTLENPKPGLNKVLPAHQLQTILDSQLPMLWLRSQVGEEETSLSNPIFLRSSRHNHWK